MAFEQWAARPGFGNSTIHNNPTNFYQCIIIFWAPSSLAYTTVHLNCHFHWCQYTHNIPISLQYILSQDRAHHCKAARAVQIIFNITGVFHQSESSKFHHHHTCSNNSREPPFKAGDGVWENWSSSTKLTIRGITLRVTPNRSRTSRLNPLQAVHPSQQVMVTPWFRRNPVWVAVCLALFLPFVLCLLNKAQHL